MHSVRLSLSAQRPLRTQILDARIPLARELAKEKNMLMKTLLSLSLFVAATAHANPQPVSEIDVEQYVGKWYEIGKLPTPDQPNCFNVTADYELLDDGQVGVINSCRIKLFWGISFLGTSAERPKQLKVKLASSTLPCALLPR